MLGVAPKKYCCLKRKRGKDNFRSVVQESMSRDKASVNKKKDMTFSSQRTRQNMCAYVKIWKDLDEQKDDRMMTKLTQHLNGNPSVPRSLSNNSKYTTLRALDFDTTFCKAKYVYDLT